MYVQVVVGSNKCYITYSCVDPWTVLMSVVTGHVGKFLNWLLWLLYVYMSP